MSKGIDTMSNRDEFSNSTKEILAKRAAYCCSNPKCRCLTLGPSESNSEKVIYTGKVAHITAASKGGPRYDPSLTPEQRSSTDNGIFLCAVCAEMIDKNNGLDFPVEILYEWKREHGKWVEDNQNKRMTVDSPTIVDGTHHAVGAGNIVGLDIQGPAIIQPGTKSIAEGIGNITATRISGKIRGERK